MSQFPDIPAGKRLTAPLLRQMLPLEAYSSGDQSVTSSTTLVNHTELVLPGAANAVYDLMTVLYYSAAAATGDLDYAWTLPAGASLRRGLMGPAFATTGSASEELYQSRVSSGATTRFSPGGAGGNHKVAVEWARILMGSTAGDIQLQFAQQASSATATTILAGSWMTMKEMA